MSALLSAMINGALFGSLIVLVCRLALWALPRRTLNAATRYVLWWAVMFVVLVLPVLFVPDNPPPSPATLDLSSSDLALPPLQPSEPLTQTTLPSASRTPTSHVPAGRSWSMPSLPIRVEVTEWPAWIVYGWMAISLILLLRLTASYILLQRICKRAGDAPLELSLRLREWTAYCGGRRRDVRLACSPEINVPVAAGPTRPCILIPASMMEQLNGEELDQLGLHEAAHLARADDWALLVQRVLEALFVLNPAVWFIGRELDLEREVACDDLVIGITGRPRSYALGLTRIVELSGAHHSSLSTAAAVEAGSHLTARVELLLDKTRHTGTSLLKGRLSVIVAAVIAIALLVGRSPALIAFPGPFLNIPLRLPVLTFPQVPLLSQSAEPVVTSGQELSGTVLEDSSGNPIASAELRFHKRGMRELAADLETDRDGRFQATELPPGEYTVDLAKPNYITTTFQLQVPSTGVMLRLVRYGVIDGIATDAMGRPLPGRILASGGRTIGGARVTVLVKQRGSESLRSVRQMALAEGGRFRVFDLPPGQYAIGLWYSGLNEGAGMQLYPDNANPRFFTVSGGEEYRDINFTVTPRESHQLSGRVELPAGKGQFQLALGLPEQPLLPIAQTLTEDDGSFRFERVPAGVYDLFVSGPVGGYGASDSILGQGEPLFGRTRVRIDAQDVSGLSVPLSQGRSAKLVVRAHDSNTLPVGCPSTTAVSLVSLEPWGTEFTNKATVRFGAEAAISNLAPGRFRVVATGLDGGCYQVNQPVVDLNAASADPVILELSAVGSIRGSLNAVNARTAGVSVVLLAAENNDTAEAKLAFPNSDGRFAFDRLRPGRYRIAARPPGSASSQARWVADISRMQEVEVRSGAPTTLELNIEQKGEQP